MGGSSFKDGSEPTIGKSDKSSLLQLKRRLESLLLNTLTTNLNRCCHPPYITANWQRRSIREINRIEIPAETRYPKTPKTVWVLGTSSMRCMYFRSTTLACESRCITSRHSTQCRDTQEISDRFSCFVPYRLLAWAWRQAVLLFLALPIQILHFPKKLLCRDSFDRRLGWFNNQHLKSYQVEQVMQELGTVFMQMELGKLLCQISAIKHYHVGN